MSWGSGDRWIQEFSSARLIRNKHSQIDFLAFLDNLSLLYLLRKSFSHVELALWAKLE